MSTDVSAPAEPAKVICLWTVPRACSTVFERCMMNRTDVFETFHEPRGIPYYYGPPEERGSQRYIDQPVRMTHSEVTVNIVQAKAAAPPGSYVFIKDMAYYLCDKNGTIGAQLLEEVLNVVDVHTFLIRNPEKQVSSLYKMSTTQQDTVGWDEFIPTEVGYEEMSIVYEALEKQNKHSVTIDADDVLRSPAFALEKFCSEAGIPFSDRMLTWEANEERIVRKFEEWGGWHDSAISSTGWARKHTTVEEGGELKKTAAESKKQEKQSKNVAEGIADESTAEMLKDCVTKAMVHYKPFFSRRVGGLE
mmetsp:Transcript_28545/g.48260  ORF Transcript_28545/g.48260 Transcript_28545/m.48260 type:complete len:305 (+) Transcript_28545:30-944(+)